MDDENIELTEEHIEEQIKKLKERLKVCQKEKGEYLDGWQRAKADFINARQDEEKRIEYSIGYAKADIVKEFLTLADSLDIAEKHNPTEELTQVHRQFLEILKKQGVRSIESTGEIFNPALHEALMKAEIEDERQDNIVIEELQKGYMMYDTMLRPSKVKVGIYKLKE